MGGTGNFYREDTRRGSVGSDFKGGGGGASDLVPRRRQSGYGITEWEGGGRVMRWEI